MQPSPTLQARMSPTDQRLYRVEGDLAHNAEWLMKVVAGRLEDETWPAVSEYLRREGVGQDQLGEACKAYVTFLMTSCDDPKEGMTAALERCGWEKVPEPAKVALMAYLGTAVVGLQWTRLHEAKIAGVGPADDLKGLGGLADRAGRLLLLRGWRRRAHLLAHRLRKTWATLRGRG